MTFAMKMSSCNNLRKVILKGTISQPSTEEREVNPQRLVQCC